LDAGRLEPLAAQLAALPMAAADAWQRLEEAVMSSGAA